MKYYVNNPAQSNAGHEVHKETCPYLSGCCDAVDEAKKTYATADGCATCSPGYYTH